MSQLLIGPSLILNTSVDIAIEGILDVSECVAEPLEPTDPLSLSLAVEPRVGPIDATNHEAGRPLHRQGVQGVSNRRPPPRVHCRAFANYVLFNGDRSLISMLVSGNLNQ